MYRTLRYLCIALSALTAILAAASALNLWGLGDSVGRWLGSMQLLEAIVTASTGWLLLWGAVTLIFGRIYCSTVCPLGFAQDIAAALWRKAARRKRSFRYMKPLTTVRVLSVAVLAEGLCMGITGLVEYMDPYADYQRMFKVFGTVSLTGWVTAAVIVAVLAVATRRHGRILCNTVCPVGSVLGALTPVSLLRFDINPDVCTHCGECERVCPAQCINQTASTIDNSRCVSCFACADSCPDKALTWRIGRHRLQWPLIQRVQTQPTAMSAPDTAAAVTRVQKANNKLSK